MVTNCTTFLMTASSLTNLIEILPNVGNIIAFVSGGLLVYFGNIYATWIRNQYEIQYGQKNRHQKLLKDFKLLVDKFNDVDITYRIQYLKSYEQETYLVECCTDFCWKDNGLTIAEIAIETEFEKLNVELIFITKNNSLMTIDSNKPYDIIKSSK